MVVAMVIVYKAAVKTESDVPDKSYIGCTEDEFKTRHRNHKTSINNRRQQQPITLSAKIWELNDTGPSFSIN